MSSVLVALALAAARPNRLPPIDQCTKDISFRRFRQELTRISKERDSAALLEVLDDNVMTDFGPEGTGKAAFTKTWQFDEPDSSAVWDELGTILRLGCTVEDGVWAMPSLGHQLKDDADPFDTLLAVEPNSALRAEPSDDAKAIAKLNWDVLSMIEVLPDSDWFKVKLRDGRTGFVRKAQVRNPLDYRMIVQRTDTGFRITAFVAGD